MQKTNLVDQLRELAHALRCEKKLILGVFLRFLRPRAHGGVDDLLSRLIDAAERDDLLPYLRCTKPIIRPDVIAV